MGCKYMVQTEEQKDICSLNICTLYESIFPSNAIHFYPECNTKNCPLINPELLYKYKNDNAI